MVNAPIRLGVALALALVALRPVAAQVPFPEQPVADLDPSAPMADLPDMEGLSPEAASPADTPAAVPETPDTRTGTVRYRTELAGLAAAGIEARFATLSKLGVVGETENLAQIDRRARSDLATIEALMRAAGYYAAEISFSVTPATVTGERAAVRIVVEPGERYLFSTIDIGVDPGPVRDLSADLLGLKTGEPVDSFVIEAAEARLGNGLRQNGYPFARVGDRDLLVDHDARAIAYTLKLAPGLRARFGEIRLDNRRLMGPKHVALLSRFKPGDLFDAEKVEDFRRAMVATGLFSTVIARPVPTEAANEGDQIVDIAVATQPAPPRTLSGQGGYSTGEGFRIEAGWQHRALIRPEGALTVRGILGTEEQRLAGEVRFSNFRRRDNSLLLRSELSHENRSAYTARTFSLGGRFERTTNLLWQKLWTWSFLSNRMAITSRSVSLGARKVRRSVMLVM